MQRCSDAIQDRTRSLLTRAETATVELIEAIGRAREAGVPDARLAEARAFQRKAQFRLDFISAENSTGFHAPAEAARILAEAIDYARQGLIVLATEDALQATCVGCHNEAEAVAGNPSQARGTQHLRPSC